MPQIKAICSGCYRVIVPKGERCSSCQSQRKQRVIPTEDTRGTSRERGYTAAWTKLSHRYREQHPLCLPCEAYGLTVPCVYADHIIPVSCCPELTLDSDNVQSVCARCNARKRYSDPKGTWLPNHKRVVVCGLPGTGRSACAKSTGYPVFDIDDHPELTSIEAIKRARAEWIAALEADAACVVVVGSTFVAPHVAMALRGTVKHLADRYTYPPVNALWSA